MSVLVGYASEHGSTREIAERVAARLADHGRRVEVVALDRVTDAERYDAVVLGSAIHNGVWLGQATRFVRENADILRHRPTWLFSVGMPAALRRPLRRFAMSEGPKAIAGLRDLVELRGHRLFSGVYQKEQNRSLVGRALFAVLAGRYGDFRDWDDVDAWADDIADQLETRSREPRMQSVHDADG
ncbi:flavodoxin domain-containing protein [Pseudonocardia bannensis]|uniref:Flavodoxin n=1 Tax=Pseudonocardia bannensis TaxID=630973 RepID=A0A848DF36_9PSEU|nr:flavodoxin domain-containing protein [Pseudonocardia bannensis]NMH91196.1 flavodoxin [Pseudonocardia bannensis]